ncbi:MAG: UrcA family protein [Pseudomonadota bacterium]
MGFSVTILALAFAASMPAAVQTDSDLPRATVSFHGLDLATDAGQKQLRARLASEIRWMCDEGGPVDAHARRLRRTCVNTARASAEAAFTQAVASARRRTASQLAAR